MKLFCWSHLVSFIHQSKGYCVYGFDPEFASITSETGDPYFELKLGKLIWQYIWDSVLCGIFSVTVDNIDLLSSTRLMASSTTTANSIPNLSAFGCST